jgi:transcriptional regulator GlxA family with amidase domain
VGLLRAFALMEDNFPADLSLDKLSAEAGMSKHHFCRIFKRHLGLSPMHLLTHIRIEKAKELLRTTSLSISVVAMDVGFNDLSSFIKHFKRQTGRTPTGYKKSLRKGGYQEHTTALN